MIKKTKWLACVMTLSMTVVAHAKDGVEALNAQLNKMQSLSAQFKQVVLDSKGALLQDVSGSMQVKRPKQFSWITKDPYPQTIISDGEFVWIYDEDLEQVTVQNLDERAGNTPAMLLSGDPAKISDHFTVSSEIMVSGNVIRFTLKPKADEALFETMKVTFEGDLLKEMDLVDSLGQKTAISFEDVKLNPDLPAKTFEFVPPKGVDVIRDL